MTKDEALRLALEALENNKRTHHYCEDVWYSCPKHEDGCANDAEGDECNCGADKANAEIDATITAIKQALEQPEPESDYYGLTAEHLWMSISKTQYDKLKPEYRMACYTSPPKREPLTDERVNLVREMRDVQGQHGNWNYDPYMQGLYNGLEFALSLLESREPEFKNAPEEWIGDIKIKRDNFGSADPLPAAHGIKGEA